MHGSGQLLALIAVLQAFDQHAQYLLIMGSLKITWPESLQAAFSLVNWVFSLGGPQVAS